MTLDTNFFEQEKLYLTPPEKPERETEKINHINDAKYYLEECINLLNDIDSVLSDELETYIDQINDLKEKP